MIAKTFLFLCLLLTSSAWGSIAHLSSLEATSNGNALSETNGEGETTLHTYDIEDNELSITDALGNQSRFSYDNSGNQLSETDPLGNQTVMTYSGFQMLTETDTLGHKIVNDYYVGYSTEATDALLKHTDAEGNSTAFAYSCDHGVVAGITDAEGNKSTSNHSCKTGDKYKETDANGVETSYTYASAGKLTQEKTSYTNAAGQSVDIVTKYTLDANGNITQTTQPDGSISRSIYNDADQVTQEINALSQVTRYTYTARGEEQKVTYADGTYSEKTYDGEGNVLTERDSAGRTTTNTYDKANRLIKTTYHDGSSTAQSYYKNGWLKSKTDQNGNVTAYAYDPVGRLIKVTDAVGNATSYTYDEQGNKTSQIDDEGRVTKWAYDVMGRVLSRTLPNGEQESFIYDRLGNVRTHTDFNGDTTSYRYDRMNRQTLATYADGTTTQTAYNAKGEVESVTDANGTISYTYDNMGRLKTTTDANGRRITYAYDSAGNKTRVTADGVTTNYTYDALNRLKTVTDANGTTAYAYDDNGNRQSVTYPNGVKTTYEYDTLNRLTKQTSQQGTTVLSSYTYELYANGQRKSMTEHTGRKSTYVYDKLGRLMSEVIADVINGNHNAVYTYDKVGNRQTQTVNGTTTSYTYNTNDWLQSAGTVTYTYDDNGNTLTETDGANVTTYEYDKRNKLVKATTPSETITYQYAPNGLRTQKATSGATVDYLVDSLSGYGNVVAEYLNGTKSKDYTLGDDLISQTQGSATFYYGYDGLGSTRMLFADTGAVTDSYDYTAFGEIHGQSGSTDNTFLFSGEQYDSNVGQYYLRARYYNQAVGRFTQMDTYQGNMSDPASLHKYLYTGNDPVNMIDPTGHISMGGVMAGMRIGMSLALTAMTVYDIGSSIMNGEFMSAKDIGLMIILSRTSGAAKLVRRITKGACKKWTKGCKLPIFDSQHTFYGHAPPGGKATGVHSILGTYWELAESGVLFGYDSLVRPPIITPIGNKKVNGVYEAKIKVWKPSTGNYKTKGKSTMFPDYWTAEMISASLYTAWFKNRGRKKGQLKTPFITVQYYVEGILLRGHPVRKK